jgi:hypothetical protein
MAPANKAKRQSAQARAFSSVRRVLRLKGKRINEARISLQPAMAREGASSWAKRIRIELMEVANTPIKRTKMGEIGGRSGFIYGRCKALKRSIFEK